MTSDAELDQLRQFIEQAQHDFLADLRRLVDVDCGSYTKSGVDEVGRWMAGQLADLGAKVAIEPNTELGDTVVARFEGGGGPRALLIGHLDTVFPEGTAAERPFTIRESRAHGPGVTDMKSGLLCGLYALRAVRELTGSLPFSRLVFICNPDEEIGSPASRPVIVREAETSDVALVLECARANGDIVSARKGVVDLRLTIRGRAAHAGVEPEKGRSAIVEAAHKTLALTALNGRWPGVTVNVGVIRGGTRPNVVPETCELEVDLRATTRGAMEEAEAEIRRICETSVGADISCSIEQLGRHWPMEKSDATATLVGHAVEIARRLGFPLKDAATGGASDANTTSGMGVPTLDGLGPVGGGDHAPDEYLELDSIVPRTTLLAALLLAIGRDQVLTGTTHSTGSDVREPEARFQGSGHPPVK